MKKRYLILSLVLLWVAGCGGPFSATERNIVKLFKEQHHSALDSSEPSWVTEQQLRLLFLDKQYEEDPLGVIDKLYTEAYASHDKKLMATAAELSLLNARKAFSKDMDASAAHYVTAAELAYDFLFTGDPVDPEDAFKPRYRFMTEIYNRSVSRLIEIRGRHETPWPDSLSHVVNGRPFELTVEKQGPFLWDPTIFDQLTPAHQLRIEGLRNQYRERGLGAPLVGLVKNPREYPELGSKIPPRGVTFPMTAVLAFEKREASEGKPHRKATLAFYNSMQTDSVLIDGKQVPLEADYSTPLVLMLAKIENKGGGLIGMLESDEYADFAGIYMLEPISLTKTPVLMVHGLMSEPKTWVEMFNDLRGQKKIRENYQFWFFKYPSGLPVVYSSSILRKQLHEIYSEYDPQGQNPYFKNLLLVGHSMGGLLSRTMMQDSKDFFWDNVFKEPIETLPVSDEDREMLRELLYFERNPNVKRVVFISTPHRGSDWADKWFTKIGAGMIDLPGTFKGVSQDIGSIGQEKLAIDQKKLTKHAPNSLDNLSPSSVFTIATNKIPLADDVPYHTIYGIRKGKPGPGSSDGIVPYWSSHLDNTVSEVPVPSGHGAHRHPIAIAEVKRILKMHLESFERTEGQ
jgi:pimeloyl-ACP methyl ester carboxylesterase